MTSNTKFARTNGPVNSKVAAAAYEPTRVTRKTAVALHLLDHIGEWQDASVFNTVGGRAGDRRMRELRQDGWKIETRRVASNTFQHRLAKAPAKKIQSDYRSAVSVTA